MKNFKNSKTARVVSGFVGLAAAFVMVGPSLASADTSYVFTKTLKMGVTDQEVMNLQVVLNQSADTQVSASGVGSAGMETKYFGAKTKAAVIKFQEKYAADILTPNGLTKGTGLVGAATRAKLNAMGGSMTMGMVPGCTSTTGFSPTSGASCAGGTMMSTVPGCLSNTGYSPLNGAPCSSMVMASTTTGGAVMAMLDAASPMNSTIIAGQSVANLGVFKLTNTGTSPAVVSSVKFTRTGISSDSTLNNVYLFNGTSRITDSASVAQGVVSFSDTSANGIITIPAGASISLSVRADIAAANSVGQTIGMLLTNVTASGAQASGLPVSGPQMTIATAPAGMATVDLNANTTPVTPGSVDPQTGYTFWQNTVNVGSRDVLLSAIRFRQLGSVGSNDINNFQLFVDGTQVGTSVASADSNGYVQFSFPTPITLKAGGRTIKLLGDIVGGSSKNFQFSLQQAADLQALDSQLNITIAPTINGSLFSAASTGSGTINSGLLTITKTTDSPSGNVVLQGTAVTFAKFTFHAAGEPLKVQNLNVGFQLNGSSTLAAQIRNGSIFANGVQIGSTQNITDTGTTFNLGSSLIVTPGTDVVVEIHGDVFNTGAGGQFANGNTILAQLLAPTSANVYKQVSYGYITSGTAQGSTLTVSQGSVTLSKYTAYANQTITVPQTAIKIGDYSIAGGSTEGVNLDTFTLGITASDVTQLTNLYVVYNGVTSQVKSSGAASVSWSVNDPVAANANQDIAVYANLSSALTGSVSTSLQVSGTSQSSGNAVNSGVAVNGQTLSVGAGTISVASDASTPVSAQVVAGTMPKVASFRFTSSNDSYTIDQINLHVSSNSTVDAGAISALVFKDGATTLKTQPLNGINAVTTGLSIAVPVNTNKVIDVYAQLGSIGTGYASTSANVGVTLDSFEAMNSNGVKATTNSTVVGNQAYAFKTKPTITNVALPTTVLTAGTQTVYQFTLTADAGGTVAWRKLKLNVATTSPSGSSFVTDYYTIYDAANQSTPLTNVSVATTSNSVTFTSGIDQEVSGSKTYVVKATITGTVNTGASVSVSTPTASTFAPATAAALVSGTATFIWSDESSQPHSDLTQDWNNDFLVKNLPTDSETMTK